MTPISDRLSRRTFLQGCAAGASLALWPGCNGPDRRGSAAMTGREEQASIKLATCNEPWGETPIEEVFAIAAGLGFRGVEIAPFTLADHVAKVSPARRKEIARAASDTGIEVVGLHWLFVTPKGLHLTTPDVAVRRRSVEYLRQLADFCADLGGTVMIFGSPAQRNIESPTTFDEGWKRAKDVFAACSNTLAERNVTLCIEALPARETNFIQTIDEAATMADEIGNPHIDIMLDCKTMASMPGSITDTITRFGRRAKHFHANEAGGKGVGMPLGPDDPPAIDFQAAMKALVDSGYNGWVSTEFFDYKPDPTTVARTGITVLKEALAKAQS